jgi:hypothetical protein
VLISLRTRCSGDLNCSCGDFVVDGAGGFRARIGEAPALEGAQVSAEVQVLDYLDAGVRSTDKQP